MDTGSGFDIICEKDVAQSIIDAATEVAGLDLNTANGLTPVTKAVTLKIAILNEEADPLLEQSSPPRAIDRISLHGARIRLRMAEV